MKGTFYVLFVAVLTWRAALAAEPIQPTVDTRQQVPLAPFSALKLRTEMRQLLQSVHEIIGAATSDDLATVERAARASGMTGAADTDPQIEHRVPPGFHDLGMQTHRTFDVLAEQAKAGATRDDILKTLSQITAQCVACHAAYRLVETR